MGAGIVLALIGLALWVFVSGPSGACQSGLGQAAQSFSSQAAHDCQVVDLVHLLAIPAFFLGLILLFVGVVVVRASTAEPGGTAVVFPPAWYDDRRETASDRWWDGQRWTDYRRPRPPPS